MLHVEPAWFLLFYLRHKGQQLPAQVGGLVSFSVQGMGGGGMGGGGDYGRAPPGAAESITFDSINKMNDAFETFVLYIQSAVHAKLTC